MGLFSKKDACPVCGGEVKGLFLVKIGDKKTLCKDCSKQVSMPKAMMQNATPEVIREHLEYRRKNAEKYALGHWDIQTHGIVGFQMGVDEQGKMLYLIHDDLHDDETNPVVFDFDKLTGYELYRRNKKIDDMAADDVSLETGWSAVGGIAHLMNGSGSSSVDSFRLKLTADDPYWSEMEMKIEFTTSQFYGLGGFQGEMEKACRMLKCIIRKQPLTL